MAASDIAAVRSHLVQGLGPPTEVLELSGSPDPRLSKLEIACWTPAGPTGPMILVTCGLSKIALPSGQRVEGMLLIKPAPAKEALNAVVKLLGRFGLFAAQSEAPMTPGIVIRAPHELAEVASMPCLVLLPALTFPPAFRQIRRSDQALVDLVWLVPLHDVEAKVVEEQGGEALILQLSAHGVDLAAWRRDAIPRVLSADEAKAKLVAQAPPPPTAAEAPKSKDEKVAQLKATALERQARVGGPPRTESAPSATQAAPPRPKGAVAAGVLAAKARPPDVRRPPPAKAPPKK